MKKVVACLLGVGLVLLGAVAGLIGRLRRSM